MRPASALVLALTLALPSFTACKRETRGREPPAAAAAPTAAPAAPAPASAAPATAATGPGGDTMRSLAGRLQFEAANRPTGTTRADDVFVALAAAGVPLEDTKQYLGLTAAASYCAGGRTADGLAIAVCEYPDPAAAAAGRARVTERFPVGPGRRITVRGATTLTTTAPDETALAATRARVEAVFTAM